MKKLLLASALASTLGSVAGAAVTTSGNDGVRWSGTTPGLPDVCEFYDIRDGVMEYFEGESSTYDSIGGRWIATEGANIYVRHRGASHLVVEALNVVYNSSDGTEYDAQVDYNIPNTVGQLTPSDYWQGSSVNPDYPTIPSYGGNTVVISAGANQWQDGTGWVNTVHNKFTPVLENQADDDGWQPDTTRGLYNPQAEDRAIFNLVEDVELGLANQLSVHQISISGIAWMVDDNGDSKYDADNYGMTEGSYFAPHKVSCIQ